jgi:hypothetical protein
MTLAALRVLSSSSGYGGVQPSPSLGTKRGASSVEISFEGQRLTCKSPPSLGIAL